MADNSTFAATVDRWATQSKTRMTAIFRESAQRTVSLAQDRIPVDTGFARASVRASIESMPPIDPSAKKPAGGSFGYDPGEITLVIAGAELGQQLFIGWSAAYVIFLEQGSSKQAPSGFVRLSAMEWPQIVSEVVADAKSRVG
ncbi:MAG: hypothetical protein JWP25_8949 [Bradyrhizobium sp.]|nr:hypothetical protein [Bradyrhizobium sp.]